MADRLISSEMVARKFTIPYIIYVATTIMCGWIYDLVKGSLLNTLIHCTANIVTWYTHDIRNPNPLYGS